MKAAAGRGIGDGDTFRDGATGASGETTLIGARVVTGDGVISDGWVRIAGSMIVEVGGGDAAPEPSGEVIDLCGAWLLPGFIDIHMHGGGGHSVAASAASMRAAVDFHRRHGTTRNLISLVAAPVDELAEQLGWIAELTRHDIVLGGHLEGPFLSRARCGAQNPAYLVDPDHALLARLHEASAGTLRMVTIAPELPGAVELVADARRRGVVAALGHSDATCAQAQAGIAAGATVATHLFNGMRPLNHREPGVVGAAIAAGLFCELINDGVHVNPVVARLVENLVLVTDAMEAAGSCDGDYLLGGQHVVVSGGVARVRETGSLAGSTATMASLVRRTVQESGLSLPAVAEAASGRPAALLGIADRFGAIAPGRMADLVVLDDDLEILGVLIAGGWSTPVCPIGRAGRRRPPRPGHPHPHRGSARTTERPSVVAVDVGGTTIKGARFADDGVLLAERVVPTPVAGGPDAIVAEMRAVASGLMTDGVRACGVVVPGAIDAGRGIALHSVNLGWRDLAVRELIAAEVGVPTVFGHDVRSAAFAERELGASHGVADSIVITIGTGVAAVAVAEGRPLLGATTLAGELGHLSVVPGGEICPCGQRGCLERYASAAAISRHYQRRTGEVVDARVVASRIEHDADAAATWQQATDTMATALCACTALLDPSVFVLAGGLAESGDALAEPIRCRLTQLIRFRPVPPVVISPLGGSAGRIGAALLAWDAIGGADLGAWRRRTR